MGSAPAHVRISLGRRSEVVCSVGNRQGSSFPPGRVCVLILFIPASQVYLECVPKCRSCLAKSSAWRPEILRRYPADLRLQGVV